MFRKVFVGCCLYACRFEDRCCIRLSTHQSSYPTPRNHIKGDRGSHNINEPLTRRSFLEFCAVYHKLEFGIFTKSPYPFATAPQGRSGRYSFPDVYIRKHWPAKRYIDFPSIALFKRRSSWPALGH
ncbi:nonribosomal peptide synthase [Histoplasma ohiense]|nr:nonribosomal peptide synthase [Histoplasma ohiense (nom. inval.)]